MEVTKAREAALATRGRALASHERRKFQVIYAEVGNLEEAMAWMDDMHVWGAFPSGQTRKPNPVAFAEWAEEVDMGLDTDIPQVMRDSVTKLLMKRPQWQIHALNKANIAAARSLADAKVNGERVVAVEVAYFNNAIGSNAAAITALRNGQPRAEQTFQIGKLLINAGPRPVARITPQAQRGAKQGQNRRKVVDAEFRELP